MAGERAVIEIGVGHPGVLVADVDAGRGDRAAEDAGHAGKRAGAAAKRADKLAQPPAGRVLAQLPAETHDLVDRRAGRGGQHRRAAAAYGRHAERQAHQRATQAPQRTASSVPLASRPSRSWPPMRIAGRDGRHRGSMWSIMGALPSSVALALRPARGGRGGRGGREGQPSHVRAGPDYDSSGRRYSARELAGSSACRQPTIETMISSGPTNTWQTPPGTAYGVDSSWPVSVDRQRVLCHGDRWSPDGDAALSRR